MVARQDNAVLTVYQSMETHELVGCKIKGVRRLLQKLGQFGILIQDDEGPVLGLLALAARSPSSTDCTDLKKERDDSPFGVRRFPAALVLPGSRNNTADKRKNQSGGKAPHSKSKTDRALASHLWNL